MGGQGCVGVDAPACPAKKLSMCYLCFEISSSVFVGHIKVYAEIVSLRRLLH